MSPTWQGTAAAPDHQPLRPAGCLRAARDGRQRLAGGPLRLRIAFHDLKCDARVAAAVISFSINRTQPASEVLKPASARFLGT